MTILITGVTGHIGFRTLLYALDAGYIVRAAVRSQSKADTIANHPQILARNPSYRLTFVLVPDLTAAHAYDDAARDVSHIIHIASPLQISGSGEEIALNEQNAYFVRPAVCGTLNILEAAKKSGTVQRIVITSSLVALLPISQLTGEQRRPRKIPVLPTDRVPLIDEPYENEFEAYAASKVAALAQAEAWIQRNSHEVDFDLVHLHPSFVLGRKELATKVNDSFKGTNSLVLGLLLGKSLGAVANAAAHVDDVAMVHVDALQPFVPGNTSYIISTKTSWNDAKKIAMREFPDTAAKRLFTDGGSADDIELNIDASLTEDVFGFRHTSFPEQVRSVVGHFLELRASSQLAMRAKQEAGVKSGRGHSLRAVA